ncbi:flagellar biosynthetic protein FliO [Malikia sp.]|uniref:flagellar biosynthetic protein FliO n=1 Tax=Malikia sp. TaxID=2070706 RepID=UPI00261D07C5|nr:flagellar biosynthetic protein FliO [Malikia sp.]MDD2727873.1 flagellar biosynthetic protein FliO [Malikia sp.]
MITNLLQTTLALALVLGLLAALAWLIGRWYKPRGGMRAAIKVQAMVPLGARERAVLLEVGGRWLLVGVAAGQVNTLLEFPEPPLLEENPASQSGAASWLEKYLVSRHVQ